MLLTCFYGVTQVFCHLPVYVGVSVTQLFMWGLLFTSLCGGLLIYLCGDLCYSPVYVGSLLFICLSGFLLLTLLCDFSVTQLFMWGVCSSAVNLVSVLLTVNVGIPVTYLLCGSLLLNCSCGVSLIYLCGVSVIHLFMWIFCYSPVAMGHKLSLLLCCLKGLNVSLSYRFSVTHLFMWGSLLLSCYSSVYVW